MLFRVSSLSNPKGWVIQLGTHEDGWETVHAYYPSSLEADMIQHQIDREMYAEKKDYGGGTVLYFFEELIGFLPEYPDDIDEE